MRSVSESADSSMPLAAFTALEMDEAVVHVHSWLRALFTGWLHSAEVVPLSAMNDEISLAADEQRVVLVEFVPAPPAPETAPAPTAGRAGSKGGAAAAAAAVAKEAKEAAAKEAASAASAPVAAAALVVGAAPPADAPPVPTGGERRSPPQAGSPEGATAAAAPAAAAAAAAAAMAAAAVVAAPAPGGSGAAPLSNHSLSAALEVSGGGASPAKGSISSVGVVVGATTSVASIPSGGSLGLVHRKSKFEAAISIELVEYDAAAQGAYEHRQGKLLSDANVKQSDSPRDSTRNAEGESVVGALVPQTVRTLPVTGAVCISRMEVAQRSINFGECEA